MKRGTARAQFNDGIQLTIPVKTRTPLEAFAMLQVGQPIDQAIGYYVPKDVIEKDFFFLDTVEKLHKLAEYRQRVADNESEIEAVVATYKANQKQQLDEQQAQQAAQQAAKQPNGSVDTGTVSK